MSSSKSTVPVADFFDELAFPHAPRPHDAEHIDTAFVGAICRCLYHCNHEQKRSLLSGIDTEDNTKVAIAALASTDATTSMLRDRFLDTRRIFTLWCMSKGITVQNRDQSPEATIYSLCYQAKSALTDIEGEKWIHALINVFGLVPELWEDVTSSEARGKGKGKVLEPHSHYASQDIPLSTSTISRGPAPTSNMGNIATTAARTPSPAETTFYSPASPGQSQPWPQVSPDLSVGQPHMVPTVSVQDAAFPPLPVHPSDSAGNGGPHELQVFNPLDLSALSLVLQSVGEDYYLPDTGDLGRTVAPFQGEEGTDAAGYTATAPRSQNMTRAEFMEQHNRLRSTSVLSLNDVTRYWVAWHEWYLDFEDNAAFAELPLPSEHRPNLDRMGELMGFLGFVYIRSSGQYIDPQRNRSG